MTNDELDKAVRSLRQIGGIYDILADYVEQENRRILNEQAEAADSEDQ